MLAPATDLLDAQEHPFIAALPVVRVGLNLPDNRPCEVIADNGEISGIQVEILIRLGQAMGLRLEPVVLPDFRAALAALRERRVDVMARRTVQRARRHCRSAAGSALGEDDFYLGSLLLALYRLQRDGIGGLGVKRSLVYATGQMHFGVRNDWPLLASALSKGVAAMRPSPMPSLQAALSTLSSQADGLPQALVLRPDEQRQLAGRSVLRVGAVRGLTLLNEATPSGGHAGLAADYTQQVAARLGTAVQVVPFNSVADMLDALRAGRIHLVPFLTRTPARARGFGFSDPYLSMPYLIVARSDAPMYLGTGRTGRQAPGAGGPAPTA